MKKITLLTAFFFLLFTNKVQAQIPINQSDCYIKYHYDAAGNRVKREFVCETNVLPQKPEVINSNDIIVEDILVYPNPTYEYLFVELPQEVKNGKIIVTDLNGKSIAKYPISKSISISTSNLLPGIYMIVISNNKNKFFRKFTKL